MIEDWKKEIAILIYIKQAIDDIDESNLWPYYLPEIAATKEQLKTTEEHLGFNLDPRHRLFLEHANGWRGFYLTVDLFGTEELLGGLKMPYATMILDVLDKEGALEAIGFSKQHLIPIATTTDERDLFVITHPDSAEPGSILWFSGSEIDKFPNFDEYFLTMVDYNRIVYQNLAKGG